MNETAALTETLGEFDRLTGVLFDPKATFPDVVARGRWWVPLLLLALLGIGFTFAYTERVGWQRFMREQIEASPRTQQMPAEQKERIIEQQTQFAPIFGYVGSVLFPVVLALILAGVFLFVFNILGGDEIPFASAFAVSSYALLPYLLRSVVAFALLYLKDPADFDLQNPVASNLGAVLPADWPPWLTSTAASVDLFNLWVLLLLATGFAAAARRMKWSKACAWVVAMWVVWLVVKAGWVWIWS
ncbi:MAG: YIP1 family protein [Candidatus Acidiferrales bacterium]